jgi:hypothetical protein
MLKSKRDKEVRSIVQRLRDQGMPAGPKAMGMEADSVVMPDERGTVDSFGETELGGKLFDTSSSPSDTPPLPKKKAPKRPLDRNEYEETVPAEKQLNKNRGKTISNMFKG